MEMGQESDDEANNPQLCSDGHVKYSEAVHQGHRNLICAANRSDWNGLTVKPNAAVVQIIFYWWERERARERRQDLDERC